MTHSVGLLMEGLVAVLLLITIGFCFVLNRKIGLLRADEHMLRTTITELNKATLRAETAIKGLRSIASEANETLGEQMKEAEYVARDLARANSYGEQLLKNMGVAPRREQARAAQRQPAQQPHGAAAQQQPARAQQAAQGGQQQPARAPAAAQPKAQPAAVRDPSPQPPRTPASRPAAPPSGHKVRAA